MLADLERERVWEREKLTRCICHVVFLGISNFKAIIE